MSIASQAVDELWSLLDTPTIDPGRLIAAIEVAAMEEDLDWRTRQLIGEAWMALKAGFGRDVFTRYLVSHDPETMQSIVDGVFRRPFTGHAPTEIKFPSLPRRLKFSMKSETIKRFLVELGEKLDRRVTLTLGGSAALILQGFLDKHTEDLDLADEIPAEIRDKRSTLDALSVRFGLRLAHFQTHYLPPEWASRTTEYCSCGKILLRLVDPYDIIAGKVFSASEKHRDDVRVASRQLDREKLRGRVQEYAASVWDKEQLREQARKTWELVFLEELPLAPHAAG
jgi:hypothetical protein